MFIYPFHNSHVVLQTLIFCPQANSKHNPNTSASKVLVTLTSSSSQLSSTMGVLDKLQSKLSDHHASSEHTPDHQDHNADQPGKSATQNWVQKGQGGERADERHASRAGSLTHADTQPAASNPKVMEAIMNDKDRVGSTSQ